MMLIFCMSMPLCVFASENTALSAVQIYDEADLLDETEESALLKSLQDVSSEYGAELIVATFDSIGGADIAGYTEHMYDEMGFGYNSSHDGVLLLLCMGEREFRILSNGFAGYAIHPEAIEEITEEITPELSDGDYAEAFLQFADECEYYLKGYLYGFPFNTAKNLRNALVIGIIAGLIVALVLRGQLKTIHKQHMAHNYLKPGSLNITGQSELFLYREVKRTKKSSSGSSGGSSRSSGGGSF